MKWKWIDWVINNVLLLCILSGYIPGQEEQAPMIPEEGKIGLDNFDRQFSLFRIFQQILLT
jgi:hypothetical protein